MYLPLGSGDTAKPAETFTSGGIKFRVEYFIVRSDSRASVPWFWPMSVVDGRCGRNSQYNIRNREYFWVYSEEAGVMCRFLPV